MDEVGSVSFDSFHCTLGPVLAMALPVILSQYSNANFPLLYINQLGSNSTSF